jgi:two-component system CheB/CheR fusion protein
MASATTSVPAAPASVPSPILGAIDAAVADANPSFPVVGIGASAGGLAAFEAFFAGMPADRDPGMAFVLVQHLAPDHESLLTELVQRYTRMKVVQVEDGMQVQPNCAYIIPPNRDMAYLNGHLQLLDPVAPRGQRMTIDYFFRSLAQDQHGLAIGIVLSGTGHDGTQGIRAIKAEGGMVMVQTPASTEFDSMPRSAIATGLVDYELAPAEMPAQLMAYVAHAHSKAPRNQGAEYTLPDNALQKIIVLLRAQTRHDFSLYKPKTIHRRIERRMAVHQMASAEDYVKFLQQTPHEVDALFRDLLIGVTSFFRDPEVFAALEQHIAVLFDNKPAGSTVRVWSAGCSTGEEAYSVAILMQECMESLGRGYKVQIFATDIDPGAIVTARAGVFPASIAADMTPQRLARFFVAEGDSGKYRIQKSIRDMLIFSEQDVARDPPFSRLDLLCCRNLLIYMGPELQSRLMSMFHHALCPGGMLLLGNSETVGEYAEFFTPLDRKAKLFRCSNDHVLHQRSTQALLLQSRPAVGAPATPTQRGAGSSAKLSLRELTEQTLLQQLGGASALVNEHGDILYLHGQSGMYLEPAQGESGVSNILQMARKGLRNDLARSLHRSAQSKEVVRLSGLRVKTNGHFTSVDLTVRPALQGQAALSDVALYLVVMQESKSQEPERAERALAKARVTASGTPEPQTEAEARIAKLCEELRDKEEYLHAANEELAVSNEELKSSNEELQSVNEELQSTNEELETSKEELQSVNEELSTVNVELQTKVADLSRAYNDMNNLLAGTGIATVFVDMELRILRFTPTATTMINLIKTDTGRPLAHIVTNLVDYDHLVADVQGVLDTLVPYSADVQARNNRWYTLRVLPYRTMENVIEGAVITFIDITEKHQTEVALQKANSQSRLAAVVLDAQDAIVLLGLDGKVLAWNPASTKLYGWTEAEALAMNIRHLMPTGVADDVLLQSKRSALEGKSGPVLTQRLTQSGAVMEVWMISTALVNEAGQLYGIANTEWKKT